MRTIWRNFKDRREGNMQVSNFQETIEWFQENTYCSILNYPLVFSSNDHFTASIDRMITKMPYDFVNNATFIQPVCCFVNFFLKTWSKLYQDCLVKEWRQFSFPKYRNTTVFLRLSQDLEVSESSSRNQQCFEYLKCIVLHLPVMDKSHTSTSLLVQKFFK